MEMDVELEKLKNEVHRKVGRNIILFQKIELILKVLLARGQISGYASELNTVLEQRVTTIGKQTMGQVVKCLFENIISNPEESTNKPEELKEPWVSFDFRIQGDGIFYEEQKNVLALVVAERNELVHHLLPKWDFNSVEGGRATEQYLDQQHEKILPKFEYLKAQVNALVRSMKDCGDFLASDECEKQLELLWLRQSRLVMLLCDIAMQMARSDGWVALTYAE